MMISIDIDLLPVHWGFLFHLAVLAAVIIVLLQIQTARLLDEMRRHDVKDAVFKIRSGAKFLTILALLWTAVYVYGNGWQPWPPLVLFLAAYDVQAAMSVVVMRRDVYELRGGHPASVTEEA